MVSPKNKVIAVIQATAEKTANARERKKNKNSASGYFSVWNDAIIEHFGKEHCIAPTGKNMSMLGGVINRVPKSKEFVPKEFIEWVVYGWERHAVLFGKMRNTKYPEVPTLPWFIATVQTYYSGYLSSLRKEQFGVTSDNLEIENKKLRKAYEQSLETVKDLKQKLDLANAEIRRLKATKHISKKGKNSLPTWG